MTELEIAVAPMHRLCKKAGADRVSEAAAKELAKALEDIGVKIAKEALDFAMHAGRKTIKAEDIEIAARKVMGKQLRFNKISSLSFFFVEMAFHNESNYFNKV